MSFIEKIALAQAMAKIRTTQAPPIQYTSAYHAAVSRKYRQNGFV